MTDRTLSAEQVQELVESGAATPLLSNTEVGPTWYDDQWWYVPADAPDGADYQPADAGLSADFDRLRVRAAALEDVASHLEDLS